MHTRYSTDSEMSATAALKRAQELGLGAVFTEHFDCEFPGSEDFTFDADAYFAEYSPLRGHGLLLGAEIGIADHERENRAFVEKYPFDMVIGSLHLLHGKDLYHKEAYVGLSKDVAYNDYFSAMAQAVKNHAGVMDVLGHIDYIARCATYDDAEVDYECYTEAIDNVLKTVVECNVVMELNTRRLGDRQAGIELFPIYRRYRELGGRYATIGSDAHKSTAIGAHFDTALQMLQAARLKPVVFKERKLLPLK